MLGHKMGARVTALVWDTGFRRGWVSSAELAVTRGPPSSAAGRGVYRNSSVGPPSGLASSPGSAERPPPMGYGLGLCRMASGGDVAVPQRSIEIMTASFSEFGATLRSWRDRLTPEEVGLPPSAPRRAPGLRRQEVAQLAGVSLDYLVQLEQGRAIVPSPQVLTALARALRLTETERDHLFRLAGQPVPDESRIHDTLPGSVRRLVEQLSASPAAVYDVRWNPIAWNAMWVAVMGDPLDRPERERNMAWRYFTGLPVRVVRSARDQLEYEETIAADLR